MTTFAFSAPLRSEPYVTASLEHGDVQLRPLGAGELAIHRAVFDGLSPASRTDRFLTSVNILTAAMWQALAAVDGDRHIAWVATVDDRPVGIGRLIFVGPCTAEVAFEVVDGYQGRGVGTALLDVITTVAAARRVRRLQATVLGSNARSRHLLSKVGLTFVPSKGLLEADSLFHLVDVPRVNRPAVLRLAAEAQEGTLPRCA
jgi:RimJ/RimL family protein N-acetyltransferase